MIRLDKQDLDDAVGQSIINASQATQLFSFLQARQPDKPRFDFTHVLYYLGGLVAIGAMTIFMTLGWETFGGEGILVISIIYGALGLILSRHFSEKQLMIPAGICATFVVAITPLAVYGLQQSLDMWPLQHLYRDYHRYISWNWLYMEFATLIVGSAMIWRFRYPFLLMPVAVTLWYISMDIVELLHGQRLHFELHALVSMYFGLLMLMISFWVELRTHSRKDYAFWLFLFAVITFWGGLTAQDSDSEISKLAYCLTNLLMIGVGVAFLRRVFVVFGAIGVALYLGHLADKVFKDSWFFPMALTAIGLMIIYLGVIWQKNEKNISSKIIKKLPQALSQTLSRRQRYL